jgi:hypothetical protein
MLKFHGCEIKVVSYQLKWISLLFHSSSLDARLLTSNQYPEMPANGHLGTGFPWFICV